MLRRGLRLEYLTVGWNIAEGAIAIGAGFVAGSVALIGFGADSFVEVISGLVLIWRLRAEASGRLDGETVERVERRAEHLVGVAFLLLAAYVAVQALFDLATGSQPEASPIGILLTAISLVVMLWLAGARAAPASRCPAERSSRTRSRRSPAGHSRLSPLRASA